MDVVGVVVHCNLPRHSDKTTRTVFYNSTTGFCTNDPVEVDLQDVCLVLLLCIYHHKASTPSASSASVLGGKMSTLPCGLMRRVDVIGYMK